MAYEAEMTGFWKERKIRKKIYIFKFNTFLKKKLPRTITATQYAIKRSPNRYNLYMDINLKRRKHK